MSRTLNALLTQLTWNLHRVYNRLNLVHQDIATVDEELQNNQSVTAQSCFVSNLIIPEQEIARTHFLMRQQQQQHQLATHKETLLSEQQQLLTQQIDLKKAFKRLEKHQDAILKINQQHLERTHQNNSDEWALQRGEHR